MKALILTDNDGQIRDRDMLDLYDGFLSLNVNTQFYTRSELLINNNNKSSTLVNKEDIVCGHVDMCRAALRHLDIKEPEVPDYPDELKIYFGRTIHKMTAKSFKKILEENENFGKTYFVKSIINKLLTGFCCTTLQDFLNKAPHISNSTGLYVCNEVKFEAEYRVYVYKDKIFDVYRYWGDNWKVNINGETVESMVNLLKGKMPVFYSMDVGIVKWKNEYGTLLVECNDGYALGNYGLAPVDYAKMSMHRWQEITGTLKEA